MTKEEIIQAISDDKMMPFIQPEPLAEIVDFVIKNYKPSLPSNLDESCAIKHIKRIRDAYRPEDEQYRALQTAIDALSSNHSEKSRNEEIRNLDEAAEAIVIQMHPCMKYCTVYGDRLTIGELVALVKAGVEWMAGQFEKYEVEPEGAWIDKYGNCFTHTLDADDPIPLDNIVGMFDIYIRKV